MNGTLLAHELMRDEGLRLRPYRDAVGVLTIGYGRNLDDVGITQEEAEHLLTNDVVKVTRDCERFFAFWPRLSDVRQRVLANMVFNIGIGRVLGFRKMLAALEHQDWDDAATEMLDSKWAGQVGARADRLALMMRTGLA